MECLHNISVRKFLIFPVSLYSLDTQLAFKAFSLVSISTNPIPPLLIGPIKVLRLILSHRSEIMSRWRVLELFEKENR